MSAVDQHGRLYGRINLIDAAVIAFVIVLLPLGYGTYLLFRPAKPRIDSVSLSFITKEEIRIASGTPLVAKLKVKGTNFNPLLRAFIGETPALGFVFENPNSADVLVAAVGPNDHDLVLYDGIQEVARSAGAFTMPKRDSGSSTFIRAVGRLIELDPAVAKDLKPGFTFPATPWEFEIVALGPVQPGRQRVAFGTSSFDRPLAGAVEREAVLTVRCGPDQAENPCAVGERLATEGLATTTLTFSGLSSQFRFAVSEVLPTTPPQRARVRVRFAGGPHLSSVRAGDRDALLDERAAVITSVGSQTSDSVSVTLELGLDDSREGWRYRSQRVRPGASFVLATDRYEAIGRVESVDLIGAPTRAGS